MALGIFHARVFPEYPLEISTPAFQFSPDRSLVFKVCICHMFLINVLLERCYFEAYWLLQKRGAPAMAMATSSFAHLEVIRAPAAPVELGHIQRRRDLR